MADETETETQDTETEAHEADRRDFLRSAAVGVGALAVGASVAAADTKQQAPRDTPKVAPKLTAAEQVKETKRVQAEKLLKEISSEVEVVWVKAKTPLGRRVIQLEG
jgi:hypothetical protein